MTARVYGVEKFCVKLIHYVRVPDENVICVGIGMGYPHSPLADDLIDQLFRQGAHLGSGNKAPVGSQHEANGIFDGKSGQASCRSGLTYENGNP